MIIKILNKLLHKYMWVYERVDGDKGFVIAKNRDEAIDKLDKHYPYARETIEETDRDEGGCYYPMYLYDSSAATIDGDIFVTVVW